MKYTKKPVEIEAVQLQRHNIFTVVTFIDGSKPDVRSDMESDKWQDYVRLVVANEGLVIETLEGDMKASFGDYIIKGVKGEFYPCKPDVFELTYDKSI